MTTLNDYLQALADLVPGEHPLTDVAINSIMTRAISRAMRQHSKFRPLVVVEDLAGDGGFDYALADLASWLEGFSELRQVEYPVDDDDESANVLDSGDWQIYQKPAGSFLLFLADLPAATESMRLTYTALHTCTVTTAATIDGADETAVESLAASFYAQMLAAAYSQDQDSTIAADSVRHGDKHRAMLTLAKQYRAEYDEHIGVKNGAPAPACVVRDQDLDYPDGTDRLTHPRRYR